jgi:hypothetical protein
MRKGLDFLGFFVVLVVVVIVVCFVILLVYNFSGLLF